MVFVLVLLFSIVRFSRTTMAPPVRRRSDGESLTVDEMVLMMGTLGKMWRRYRRRRWPDTMKDSFGALLLEFRSTLAPRLDAGCAKCVGESPSDIRGLTKFLASLACRMPTPRRVHFDLEVATHCFDMDEPISRADPPHQQSALDLKTKAMEIDTQIENLKLSMKSEMEDLRRSLKKEMLNSLAESREQMKINFMSALGHMFSTSSSADGQSDVGQDAETEDMLSLEPAEHG